MRSVFLSVPMNGKTDDEIKDELDYLKTHLRPEDVAVDNFIEKPANSERLYCLAEAIKKIGECDAIILHPNWRSSKGCRIEYRVAIEYGIPIILYRGLYMEQIS